MIIAFIHRLPSPVRRGGGGGGGGGGEEFKCDRFLCTKDRSTAQRN